MDDAPRPMTWRALLAFAQALPPEQLDQPVYALGCEDRYGPIYRTSLADEDWIDEEMGDGPTRRSEAEALYAEVDDDGAECVRAATPLIAAGAPILWCDP